MTNIKWSLCTAGVLSLSLAAVHAQDQPHTPKPGSPERQAICDAARDHVMSKFATQTLPQPIVFNIDHVSVQEPYCFFEATPRFKDGSYVPANYLPDIAYNLCLKKEGDRWKVITDLSRSDVPSPDEIQAIKHRLPSDFPRAVFSPAWQNLLSR
jgi:hypothetical protein